MRQPVTRRSVLALAGGLVAGALSGCGGGGNDIPLVEFPKDLPPPPAPTKDAAKSPEGSNTSQGAPPT